jgi:hypothetical protein
VYAECNIDPTGSVVEDIPLPSRTGGLNRWRAIKVVQAGRSGKSMHTIPHDIVKEVRILQSLDHTNVSCLDSSRLDPLQAKENP